MKTEVNKEKGALSWYCSVPHSIEKKKSFWILIDEDNSFIKGLTQYGLADGKGLYLEADILELNKCVRKTDPVNNVLSICSERSAFLHLISKAAIFHLSSLFPASFCWPVETDVSLPRQNISEKEPILKWSCEDAASWILICFPSPHTESEP